MQQEGSFKVPATGGPLSPREHSRSNEATLQARLSAAMKAEDQNLLPGATDKWKVLQLFYESIPRAQVRVERVERVASVATYSRFLGIADMDECEVRYYTPAGPSQLARLQDSGFCMDDFEDLPDRGFGIPVYTRASDAYQRACEQYNLLEDRQCGERCLCVLLCSPGVRNARGAEATQDSNVIDEQCITQPAQLLLAYVIWCLQISASTEQSRS